MPARGLSPATTPSSSRRRAKREADELDAAALLKRLGPGYKGSYDKLKSEEHRKVWRNTRQNTIKDLVKQNTRLREQNERALAEAKGNTAPQACCIPWPFSQPGRARAPPSRIAARGRPEATHRGPTRAETLRTTLTQELERTLKEKQQELRRREEALPELAEDVAILDAANERLKEAGLNDVPRAIASAIAQDRLSMRSAYMQRLSCDAKNIHTSNHGVRYTEPVLKVFALAGARPSAMGALDVLRGDLQNSDLFSAFVLQRVDWWHPLLWPWPVPEPAPA